MEFAVEAVAELDVEGGETEVELRDEEGGSETFSVILVAVVSSSSRS